MLVEYNRDLSCRFYWPVLRCPSLAAFQVSPEALNGNEYTGGSVYQAIYSATPGVDYEWDFSYNQPFYAGGCQLETVNYSWPIGYAITYTQSVNLYSDANGFCAQKNACTNGSPKCTITTIREAYSLVPCDVWHQSLIVVIAGSCKYTVLIWLAGQVRVPCRKILLCDTEQFAYSPQATCCWCPR